ncbi:MAG: multicopper oxidase domain-containing protein [Acidimicrobiia bacterium]|nr:multicopper oxidase domain-containing protein [Acidimicrobiia bacterium]
MENTRTWRWEQFLIGGLVGIVIALGLWTLGNLGTNESSAEAATNTPEPVAVAAVGWEDKITPDLVSKAGLSVADEVNVANAPDMPPPITRSEQRIVEVHFDVVENVVAVDPANGVEFETWGYKTAGDDTPVIGTPGPVIRARVGDVFRFTVTNPASNTHPHNVDFHAVTGQGGGAEATVVAPGETKTIEARLLYPGVFMYHCAFGDVPEHIARGMYGGIVVDPVEPLPTADKEFYIVQSEYYTDSVDEGLTELDRDALLNEHPSMVVFNGYKGALTENPLEMNVGERARIYFVNAGIDLDSNFHPIGSHWDAVWQEGATYSPPIRGSQTTLVPAGGGVVADIVGQVPSRIILVDHALTRAFYKGAIGFLDVAGSPNPEIFEAIADS